MRKSACNLFNELCVRRRDIERDSVKTNLIKCYKE